MDYLQYMKNQKKMLIIQNLSFKPYYKWITFNTVFLIRGAAKAGKARFKPYYKWITFNTVIIWLVFIKRFKKF